MVNYSKIIESIPVDNYKYDYELKFTEVYKKYQQKHIAIREAMCLKVMYSELLCDLQEGELFAGRIKRGLVGFGLELDVGGQGGFGFSEPGDKVSQIIEKYNIKNEQYKKQVLDMVSFWFDESTIAKYMRSIPEDFKKDITNGIASGEIRLAGLMLNFEKLLTLGIPGLLNEVITNKSKAVDEGKDEKLYEGMIIAIQILIDVCKHYINNANELIKNTENIEWKNELKEIAHVLEKLIISRPETLREAIQLFWLYALVSGVVNYGRMDVFLGDYFVRDIDSGLITEERALRYLQALWKKIADRKIVFNGRVIIGGMGRCNEANADRFALAAMEATRTVIETEPQLSLRFYQGMNPALMKKAYDVIGEGRIYPMLYNDDINVNAVQKAFGISRNEAEQYLPYGCGEYTLDHSSLGSPNCTLNLLKALDATLHNGKDGLTGKPLGLETGEFNSFKTFDQLFDAYKKQVEYYTEALAKRHIYEYMTEKKECSYLFASMLLGNCIEKGKSIVDGGAVYLGGLIESFGIVNTADSLAVIKELVYDKKLMTQDQLLKIIDANYEGYEKERQMILELPKYGNDDDMVDSIAKEVSRHAAVTAQKQASKFGLDYYLIVNINNFVNVTIGKSTAATPDGRKAGDPYANGNTPTAGRDKKGVTAFLNSIVKLDPSVHAGYVHNMKFSKQMFSTERKKFDALMHTYFSKGGTQAMITVVSKDDLENAIKEPEKYGNIIVRVGGYSARFVELSHDLQVDILNRTLY